uniref:Serpentine receptor class gamma n=1 Tax=Acrobeloides nanus TaxID=290746 RepID=A0A914CS47_9BILA
MTNVFYEVLVLVEFTCMLVDFSIAAYLFLRCLLTLLKAKIEKKFDYSYMLVNYLLNAFLISSTSLIHVVYMLTFWRLEPNAYNAYIIVYTGIPSDGFAINRLVFITMMSIMVLELIPNILAFFLDKAHLATTVFGPYIRLFTSFQQVYASFHYWKILCKNRSITKVANIAPTSTR